MRRGISKSCWFTLFFLLAQSGTQAISYDISVIGRSSENVVNAYPDAIKVPFEHPGDENAYTLMNITRSNGNITVDQYYIVGSTVQAFTQGISSTNPGGTATVNYEFAHDIYERLDLEYGNKSNFTALRTDSNGNVTELESVQWIGDLDKKAVVICYLPTNQDLGLTFYNPSVFSMEKFFVLPDKKQALEKHMVSIKNRLVEGSNSNVPAPSLISFVEQIQSKSLPSGEGIESFSEEKLGDDLTVENKLEVDINRNLEPSKGPVEKPSNWWLLLLASLVVVGVIFMIRKK